MFQKRDDHRSLTICEGCYRKHHYGDDLYLKVYKHCVLRDSISLADGQRICRCGTVQHIDSDGRARKLFPVDKTDNHRGFNNENAIKCGLLNLGSTVAEEKYQGTLWKHEKQINLSDLERIDKAREQKRRLKETKSGKFRGTAFNIIRRSSQIDSSKRVAEAGISIPFQEEADEDVPIFLRNSANKHPFGSVHMALRIGPLIIENGVEQYVGCLPLITRRRSADSDVVLKVELSLQVEILRTCRFYGILETISTIVWLSAVVPSEHCITNIEPDGFLSVTRLS
jgi:hypothetical protein